MPQYLKTNTTSRSILRTIKLKLQGRCNTCSGKLPNHKGVCPVEGEEMMKRYDALDDRLQHIDQHIDNVLAKFNTHV